jgi:glycerol-3-phosphate acyltransferase PlsY
LATVFIIWRHRPNIDRLRTGTESRFSFRGKSAPVTSN